MTKGSKDSGGLYIYTIMRLSSVYSKSTCLFSSVIISFVKIDGYQIRNQGHKYIALTEINYNKNLMWTTDHLSVD
jgi:hypothetical protein